MMNSINTLLTLTAVIGMTLSQPLTSIADGQQAQITIRANETPTPNAQHLTPEHPNARTPEHPAQITVHARETLHTLSPYMTGACIEDVNHEIYGGLYSQMVYGESFQEPPQPAKIAGFHAYGGDWSVQGQEVRVSGGDGPKLISDGPQISSGRVSVEMLLPERQGGPAGLIVKVTDPGMGADRFNGYEVALDPARNLVALGRHRQNWEPITTVPHEIPVGRWVRLTVQMTESDLDVSVDGEHVLSYHDAEHPLATGAIGLRPWQRAARYRDLSVQTGDTPKPIPFVAEGDTPEISSMWRAVRTGSAQGRFALDASAPFIGRQSQQITLSAGQGEIGVENRGLNRWGMAFQAGKPYEGLLWLRAAPSTGITVALQSADGARTYAETTLHPKGENWERLTFTLSPQQTDPAGRLAVLLRQPGTATLGYAFLQPGRWGRFHDLPVRRDVAEGLRAAGLTVLRYGGSMVNTSAYRWKQMIGPRDRRPPYTGIWYPYSSNGWGIPDFLNFCEAAGVLAVPDFNMDETPQDMADFIEYANGPADSPWGRRRAEDGHPHPYHLRTIELGNEEAVDENYWRRFEPMVRAIWAKDPQIIPVVGDFAYDHAIVDPYHFTGAPHIQSLAAHKKILDLAKELGKEVWFDVHVWNQEADQPQNVDGVATFSEQLGRISPGARYKIVVFELNADKHGVQRGLGTAHAINQLQRIGDRVRIVCSANGLQPDGQNDNGWNQGLLFLNPAQVWGQPPYYVMQMLAHNALPCCVRTEVDEASGALDVTALASADGKILALQVLNFKDQPISARLALEGFHPAHANAQITALSGPLDAVNTADAPTRITPTRRTWPHRLQDGMTETVFPGHSFTILRFD
jgi:hypothetical protein